MLNGENALQDLMVAIREDTQLRANEFARLNDELEGVYRYAEDHFGGKNLYLEEMDKNVNYAESVGSQRALHRLRRQPPASLPDGETGDDGTND